MNIYVLFPLVATLAYIPLLVTTLSSRPWQRRHALFVLFLVPAMVWSLTDIFLRSNLFPEHKFLLLQIILVAFVWMAVQYHFFAASFFPPNERRRWGDLLAPSALVLLVVMMAIGYVPKGVITNGEELYLDYGKGIFIVFAPLIVSLIRTVSIFSKMLKTLGNPVLYNQIVYLQIGLFTLTVFTAAAILPWGREFPVSHLGNLVNAFILTYAIVRHRLVDVRMVLRQGSVLISLATVGAGSYWLLLVILNSLFHFELDFTATFVATGVALLVAGAIYRLRRYLFAAISRLFQGESYDYRQRLSDFADKIQNVFSLKEQGRELLVLLTKAIGCKRACLLFPETGSEDFIAQLVEPKEDNPLSSLKLRAHSPVVEYLGWERRPLMRESLTILPGFLSLWEREREEIKSSEIELFMPLISRGKLIAILALGKKYSGRYSLEDLTLLESVANRVAVSIEKEYLREQLREREEELSIINRSSVILTSSLNIQGIYDNFIREIKKVVDVGWAAITLIEENNLYFLALSSEIGSAWKVGERLPIKGTATEWVAANRKTMLEPDLSQESQFLTGKYHIMQGVRSIAYFPLIARDEVIGTLILASRHANAYNQRHMLLLEQLASQIAMPVENARLYAKAEEKARIDELTGLLNRRALDEMIASEVSRHSRYGGVFSVIILDLDSFKRFNDNFGHLAGDKLLRQMGGVIKGAIRGADQAFRYGGDEFAVLLPQTLIDAANQVAERIRRQISSKGRSGAIAVTASLGLASWPADGINSNEVIAAADAALYRAKRNGGNRSHCASGTLLPLDDLVASSTSGGSAGGSEDSGVLSAIYALAATVDARDHYTRNHSKRVSEYASALARALNLEPLEVSRLETCALLHDIGKIGIHDEILNKQGKLSAEEWEIVKVHPQLGATIISRARQLGPCVAGVLYHHEKFDGTGYPRGLKGEEIPLEARILAITDTFAAMTSSRPYADVTSFDGVLEEIKRNAGTQFDPRLVEVFIPVARDKASLIEKR